MKRIKRKREKKRKKGRPAVLDVPLAELKAIVARAKSGGLNEEDAGKLDAAVDTLAVLTRELEAKGASIRRLRKLIFGSSTEKTSKVLGHAPAPQGASSASASDGPAASEEAAEASTEATTDASADDSDPATPEGTTGDESKKKRKGHGRNGADAYEGAEKIGVSHESLKHRDACPLCDKGKVYAIDPVRLIRVTGVAPLAAAIFELERFRCNACGATFTAQAPADVGTKKYDESAEAMIALLKYGCGVPFNRMARLEKNLGIPLPASTQWDVVAPAAKKLQPVYEELIRQAAQGKVLHNDDTTMKILELDADLVAAAASSSGAEKKRTGIFTTGIVSTLAGIQIALFFTGRKHAGENLADVLAERAAELPPPIQMSDALSRNQPGEHEVIPGSCNAHSRRRYVDVAEIFPEEVGHVLEVMKKVYANDAFARKKGMPDNERLILHQQYSAPILGRLRRWIRQQFRDKRVEENSTLGEAMRYMLKHWRKLTLFLRVAGAPVDNNACERILKKAILHRKGSLFYKTQNGAWVGDLFMSLIHTAELAGVSAFDYLLEMLRRPEEIEETPEEWMPWNFRATLETIAAESDLSR
jgi:transposase